MKQIHYWTTHPIKSAKSWQQKLGLNKHEFELIYDCENPDYIIATEHIYFDRLAKLRFKKMYKPSRVALFWAGECISPDMNIFDYAMSYDIALPANGRQIRRPVMSLFGNFKHEHINTTLINPIEELRNKHGFCNFIYSNPDAHPHRDWLFHTISNYKHIDSLGPHLHNCDCQTSRGALNFDEVSVTMKRPYKFSISAENACYCGYTSEKIITSFLAHTIPIYWGNNDISSEFNPKAFVNANGLSSEELIETIRKIDEDDNIWLNMITEPPMTPEQYKRSIDDETKYCNFMTSLFSMTPWDAIQRPEGYWPNNYRRTFFAGPTRQVTHKNRLLKLFGRETVIADFIIRSLKPSKD